MKNILYIFIAVSLLLISACEKTEIVEVDLDYVEYVVVRAELKTGEIFKGVSFTRTLPANISYDIKLAEIKNAYAYIRINEAQVVPLHYISDGIYKPKHDLRINAGDVYELFAEVSDRVLFSKTRAPEKPQVVSSTYNSLSYYDITIIPKPRESYGAVWVVSGTGVNAKAPDFFSVNKGELFHTGKPLLIRTAAFPLEYQSSAYSNSRYRQVFSFDEEFFDFFQTKSKNLPVDNTFVEGGSEIKWNVKGDKVIGLFIGIAEGEISGEK